MIPQEDMSLAASQALVGLLGASAIRLDELIKRKKYDRVFFLSREGLILFRAYLAVHKGHHHEFMCYLFASRRNLGLTTCWNLNDCNRLLDIPFNPQPLGQLLVSRFGLSLPVETGVPVLVSRHDKPLIRQHLKRYCSEILARAEIEREGYLAYLEKRRMHSGGRYLLVDIGYNGTYHRAFERLLPDAHFESFCVAAFSGATDLVNSGRMHLLLDGVRDNRLKQDFFSRNVACIEFLLMAPHPSFISVKQFGGDRFFYQFDSSHLKPSVEIRRIQNLAILTLKDADHKYTKENTNSSLQLFESWLSNPSENNVQALSGLYLDDKFGGKILRSIIAQHPPLSNGKISFDDAVKFYEQSEWKDGALCLLNNMIIAQPVVRSGKKQSKCFLLQKKLVKLFRSQYAFQHHVRSFFLKLIGRYQASPQASDVILQLIANQK